MATKQCTKCGEEKPLEDFHRDKTARDGHVAKCKACAIADTQRHYRQNREAIRVKNRQRRLANLEESRARAREYARSHRAENLARAKAWRKKYPERKAASDRAWRDRNKAHKAALDKAWAQANRECVNKNWRRFRDRHPDRVKATTWEQGQKRRGERPTKATREYRVILLADLCTYCGNPTDEIDHITPRGDWRLDVPGWNEWSNLTASCLSCNRRKHAKPLLAFLLDSG